jgi:hypothetical protein
MVNELHGLSFEVVVKNPDGGEITRAAVSGDTIMAQIGFRYEHFGPDVGWAIGYLGLSFALTTFLMLFIVVEKR